MAAIDVFSAASDIGAQAFSVILVGGAVLTIFVAIAAFKYVKAALGYVPSGAMLDPIPPPPWADDSPIMTAEDFDAIYNPHFEAPHDPDAMTAEDFQAQFGNPDEQDNFLAAQHEHRGDQYYRDAIEADAFLQEQLADDAAADQAHTAMYGTAAEDAKMERDVLDYQLHLDEQADALHEAQYGTARASEKMERDVAFYKNS